MLIEHISEIIGNTPILKIPQAVHQCPGVDLYAKLELCNPFGSVKDRIAHAMIKDELPEIIEQQKTIVENSSGNTAKALAALASISGVPFRLVSGMVKVKETREVLKLLGADIQEISSASDCFDPNDPNDPQFLIERSVRDSGGKIFFPTQFTNKKNPAAHYQTTAEEILNDLKHVDILCSGLGTSGSTLGISNRLRKANPKLQSVAIVAHRQDYIPGIRSLDQMWESGLFQKDCYQEFMPVSSLQAVDAMLLLIRRCGLLCGPSSGANFSGCLQYLKSLPPATGSNRVVVFIACDRAEWYLSYIKERRPEIFGEKPRPFSMQQLLPTEIASSAIISCQQANEWTKQNNALVVDIRSNFSFGLGSIPAAINIPLEHLEQIMSTRTAFCTDRPVLFICQIGDKSRRFAAQLNKTGGQGYSLEGGLQRWRSCGLPLDVRQD